MAEATAQPQTTYSKAQIDAARRILSDPSYESMDKDGYAAALAVKDSGAFDGPLGTSDLNENPAVGNSDVVGQIGRREDIGDIVVNNTPEVVQDAAVSAADKALDIGGQVAPWIPDWMKKAYGAGETATSFGTGALSMIPATAGFYRDMIGAYGMTSFMDALDNATQNMQDTMGNLTFTPRTEAGKDLTAVASMPFLALDNLSSAAGNKLMDIVGGNLKGEYNEDQLRLSQDFKLVADEIQSYRERDETPPAYLFEAATSMRQRMTEAGMFDTDVSVNNPAIFANVSLKALIDLFPDMAVQGSRFVQNKALVSEFRSTMDEFGVDIAGATDDQIREWANLLKSDGKKPIRFDALKKLQEDTRLQQEKSYQSSEALYKSAEAEGGYFPGLQLTMLNSQIANLGSAKKWQTNIPRIAPFLEKLNTIITKPNALTATNKAPLGYPSSQKVDPQGGVMIAEQGAAIIDIWDYRKEINKEIGVHIKSDRPKDVRYTRALLDVKNTLDQFMDDQFAADTMALGEEMLFQRNSLSNASLAKWKRANDFYINYKRNFNEQSVVKKLLDNDMTAKSVTNMILGFSAGNLKSEAANIVRSLQNIFPDVDGQLSGQLQAIKTEMKMAVFHNLLVPEMPNTTQFRKDYNKWKANNNEVIDILFTDDEMKSMDLLYKVTQAQERVAANNLRNRPGFNPESIGVNDITGNFVALNLAGGNPAMMKAAFQANIIRKGWKAITNALGAVPNFELTNVLPGQVGRNDTGRRAIMSELYGTDLRRPLRSLTTFKSGFATEQSRLVEEAKTGDTEEGLGRMGAPPIIQRQFEQSNYTN